MEWLLSLVQSLKKVIFELHLDPSTLSDATVERESEAKIKGSASSLFLNLQAEKYEQAERERERSAETNMYDNSSVSEEWKGRHEIASRRLHFLLSRLQMLLGLSSKVL